jgi:hypothetical protein
MPARAIDYSRSVAEGLLIELRIVYGVTRKQHPESAAPIAATVWTQTRADHAIQPRSPLGGRGIGGEYLGTLTTARSRLRACDI